MNYKVFTLFLCAIATSHSWGMQQAHIKAAPASFATVLAQNPRYLLYASAGCFAGAMFLDTYFDVQWNKSLRKAEIEAQAICRSKFERNEISSPAMHARIYEMKIEAQKRLRKQYMPLAILTVAFGISSVIAAVAGFNLMAKNKLFAATAK